MDGKVKGRWSITREGQDVVIEWIETEGTYGFIITPLESATRGREFLELLDKADALREAESVLLAESNGRTLVVEVYQGRVGFRMKEDGYTMGQYPLSRARLLAERLVEVGER
jgi:hypothetical protein